MTTWKYIGVLLAFIGGVAGYAFADSEVRTVVVTDKYTQSVEMRRGRSATRYVLETDHGALPILNFPVLGYSADVEEVYEAVPLGEEIKVRVAQWPPRLLGPHGKPHILAVY